MFICLTNNLGSTYTETKSILKNCRNILVKSVNRCPCKENPKKLIICLRPKERYLENNLIRYYNKIIRCILVTSRNS